jgi:hypothetical protein
MRVIGNVGVDVDVVMVEDIDGQRVRRVVRKWTRKEMGVWKRIEGGVRGDNVTVNDVRRTLLHGISVEEWRIHVGRGVGGCGLDWCAKVAYMHAGVGGRGWRAEITMNVVQACKKYQTLNIEARERSFVDIS